MIVLEGSWEDWPSPPEQASVTVGVLDGVHLGHRALLAHLEESMVRTVLTFDPHPLEVLRPEAAPRLLTTIAERTRLLGDVGVDRVGVLDLGEIRDLPAARFIEDIVVGKGGAGHVVVGEDFRFGKDRFGDVGLLSDLGPELGYTVEVIDLVSESGAVVSSSRIRELIVTGDVAAAASLLGSTYSLTAEVVAGDRRGRQLGFPTANMRPPERKLIPADGVYACHAEIDGRTYSAAVNVGVRPTFGGGERLVEAFILDFDEDIYGNELTIRFVQYLRPELEFEQIEELVERMAQDVEEARRILSGARSGM